MAITQTLCTSFKKALFDGEVDFSADSSQTFKIALYTSSADLSASTTAYATTNEVSGTGYTAGGNTLTVVAPTTSGTTAYLDFADTIWNSATITARGALIYRSTTGNPAIAVLDFGADKSTTGGAFEIKFPVADASNAIIRLA
jgi:hypothetical protein|tara:strand:- start:1697 stop:2125 length:429 start_codon:yes stop_codon:yes gene_type:complete